MHAIGALLCSTGPAGNRDNNADQPGDSSPGSATTILEAAFVNRYSIDLVVQIELVMHGRRGQTRGTVNGSARPTHCRAPPGSIPADRVNSEDFA